MEDRLNVLAVYTDVAHLASFDDAPAGAANTNRCSALVAGSSRLVTMEYIRMILTYKFTGGARRSSSLMIKLLGIFYLTYMWDMIRH